MVISLTILVSLFSMANVYAAPSSTMSISGATEVGSIITVSVRLNVDGLIGGYDGYFSYRSEYLELQSISQGDYTSGGFFTDSQNFGDYGFAISSGTVVLRAKFKCMKEGSDSISCYFNDVGDDAGISLGTASCGTTINIVTPVPKSSNTNLSSLTVSPGTLSPSFSKSTKSYSVAVDEDQSKISISAVPEDSKSSVSLNGVQNNLKPGSNTVKITVKAENGSTTVYSIAVTRASGPTGTPTPTPKPLPLVEYLENELMIIPFDDDTTVPEGFSATTATYKGVEIPVFKGPASEGSTDEILLVQLLTEQKIKLFVYDPAEQIVYPLLFIAQKEASLRLLDAGDSLQAPTGYEKFIFTYDEEPVNAYRLISDPDNPQILLYMMNAEGKEVFYYFDTEQEMLMPYRGETVIVDPTLTPTPSVDPSAVTTMGETTVAPVSSETQPAAKESKSLLDHLSDFKSPFTIMFYLVALIALVLIAAVISLMIGRRGDYDEDDYDEDYLPEEETVPPLAVDPAGTIRRIPDPDDVFEENFEKNKKQSETDYIPSIVRSVKPEKPVDRTAYSSAVGKVPERPIVDPVSVMGVRKVQSSSIPELAEQSKTDHPIPEHIPVRLKIELDEQMNKGNPEEKTISRAEDALKETAENVSRSAPATASPALSVSTAPATPVSPAPGVSTAPAAPASPAPGVPSASNTVTSPASATSTPKATEFGFKYIPGYSENKTTVEPKKVPPSLDFPDITKKIDTPADPDLE